ncbi:MAG TPA: hypothetical protein VM010_00610 [Chitinophagaceae bacterium]|nr:hypothetical protein [Chitinophagaceae bacterium]
MNNKQAILQCITQQGMLPLFYHDDAAVSMAVLRTLYNGGIRAVEYTNRGHAALPNFQQLKAIVTAEMPDLALGIGTIKNGKEATQFIEAGADFLVSPVVQAEVALVANQAGLLWVPGCMTPTEINTAQQNEALLIKLFPADLLKPGFVLAIKELFPGQLFMPTGGISLDKKDLEAWFKAGVCAVGMGSRLITKDILNKQLYAQLYQQTIDALNLVQDVKRSISAPDMGI